MLSPWLRVVSEPFRHLFLRLSKFLNTHFSYVDSQYSNILTLKSLKDRTFGCGVVQDEATMLFMNSEVLMKVELNLKKIQEFDPT